MKILFIVPYPTEGPSNRFRVEQYLPILTRSGTDFSVRPFCNSDFYGILLKKGRYFKKFFYLIVFTLLRIVDLFRAMRYDVVFIHREAFPTKDFIFEWLFRKFSRKIIYDFDDSVFLKKPAKVKMLVSKADRVITGNNFLEGYALHFNKNVTLIPTCIDTDKYAPSSHKNTGGKVIIGWMGSPTTSVFLSEIKEVFNIISDKYKNVEFRIIGGRFTAAPSARVLNRPWNLASEVRDMQEFDIGIMPMPDDEWTRGKCAFKIIEYMALGIPAVASPVGMNSEVIKDGVNGFLAGNQDEWLDKLSRLIESAELRQALGRNGRNTIEERYSLRANASKFIDVVKDYVHR